MEILNRLLEISIYSVILFLAIIGIKRVFKNKMSPALHFVIWFLLIARLCVPVTIDSGLRLIVIPETPAPQTTTQTQGAAADSQDNTVSYMAEPRTNTNLQTIPQTQQANINEKTAQIPSSHASGLFQQIASMKWTDIFIAVWLIGMLFVGAWMIYIVMRMNRIIFRLGIKPKADIRELLEKCKTELGIKKDIPLYLLPKISTPALTIGFKPKLVLPFDIAETLSGQQLEFAIKHELTHYKRKDNITSLVLRVLEAVYWFNPVVWLMAKSMLSDMETACDSMVVAALNKQDKKRYVLTLLDMFSNKKAPQFMLGMALNNTEKVAEKRIRGVYMKNKSKRSVKLIAGILASVLIVACFTTACQPTPEEEIIINKGDNAINSAIQQTAQVQALYKAPATLKYTKEIDNVLLNIDATVSVPNATSFGIYKVKMHNTSQEEADRFIKSTLGDGPYFDAGLTKEYYDDMIIDTRKSIDEIENMDDNLFQRIYDPDETKESVITALNGSIDDFVKERESAPSRNDRRPIDTTFIQDEDVNGWYKVQVFVDTDKGIAKTAIDKRAVDSSTFYLYELDAKNASLTISEEQAKSVALEFLKELDLQDEYSIYNSELISSSNTGPIWNRPDTISEKIYVFDFSRMNDGVPMNVIEGASEMVTDATSVQQGDEAYSYFPDQEIMQMLVNDSGVISFYWRNHYDVIETTNENASLLSFGQIQGIIEGSSVYSKFFLTDDKNAELKITDIKLGNMRVKSPDEQDTYLIIPVWDIIGKKVDQAYDSSIKGEMPDMSYLTINALDGSIIDRNLGY